MGSVDHVTLKGNSEITGNNCTGGIVGGNNNSVTNCSAENVTVIVIGDNEFEENHIVQADVAECGGLVIGGGFGGTIQAFVPLDITDKFIERMDYWLGEGSSRHYRVSDKGAYATWL